MSSIENQLPGLFETMAEGVVLHELVRDDSGRAVDYRIHDVNPAFTAQVGISRESAVGALASVLYGADEAPYLDVYARVAETGEPARFQTYFPPMDQHFDISVFSPRKDWFATIFLDITPLKRMENQLRMERDRLAAVMEASPVGLIQIDRERRVTFANERAEQLMPLEVDPESGMKVISDRTQLLDADGQPLNDETRPFSRVMRHGEAVRAERVHAILPDGAERHFTVSGVPIRDGQGEIYGLVGSIEDTTEQVRAEREREHLKEQLERKHRMESIGRLAGGIAHDFNNLLTPILGYTEMSLRSVEPDSTLARNLERVNHSAERARELISRFLAVGRKRVLEVQVCSLNALVTDYEGVLRRLVREDIRLVLELDRTLGNVRADPSQLQQILLNLASNAVDAMPRAGQLTIETHNVVLDEAYAVQRPGVVPGDYVLLVVCDTGEGMDAATRARIFEPFFTTKEGRKGTGLGLATVYGLVKQHRGHARVHSEPGAGTSFEIYLPRVYEQPTTAPRAPERARSSRQGCEVILLVEDDQAVRALARTILEQQGYVILEAADSDAAVGQASSRDGTIDLLLTDVIVPRMNGREIYRAVRRIHSEVRVLYMSGYPDNVIGKHGILDEGTHFLAKPFSAQDLLRRVEEALAG